MVTPVQTGNVGSSPKNENGPEKKEGKRAPPSQWSRSDQTTTTSAVASLLGKVAIGKKEIKMRYTKRMLCATDVWSSNAVGLMGWLYWKSYVTFAKKH